MLLAAAALAGDPGSLLLTRPYRPDGLDSIAPEHIPAVLEQVAGGPVRWVDATGASVPMTEDAALIELIVGGFAVEPGPFEELLLAGSGLVQVVRDADGARVVMHGEGALAPLPSAPADLAERMGGSLEGAWTPAELAMLWAGWEHLLPAERLALDAAVYRRIAKPMGSGAAGAITNHRYRAPYLRLDFWDTSVDETFSPVVVGTADQLFTVQLRNVVHEMGHAVAYAPYYDGWSAKDSLRGAERRAAKKCAKKGYWSSPVIEAFVRVGGEGFTPTDYGEGDAGEAFADSFALFELHPEALRVRSPEVFAWFDEGGHLAWRSDPAWKTCHPRRVE